MLCRREGALPTPISEGRCIRGAVNDTHPDPRTRLEIHLAICTDLDSHLQTICIKRDKDQLYKKPWTVFEHRWRGKCAARGCSYMYLSTTNTYINSDAHLTLPGPRFSIASQVPPGHLVHCSRLHFQMKWTPSDDDWREQSDMVLCATNWPPSSPQEIIV
jgi:hypothetical protein